MCRLQQHRPVLPVEAADRADRERVWQQPKSTGAWHHYVATKNGATTKIYKDGVDVTQFVGDQTITNVSTTTEIGTAAGPVWNYYGSLDEICGLQQGPDPGASRRTLRSSQAVLSLDRLV